MENCRGSLGSRVSADASSARPRRATELGSILRSSPTLELRDAPLGVVFVLGEDTQPVVHPQRAECANEDVGSTPVHAGTDNAIQRDVPVIDLDRDDRPALAAAGPERRVLFQPIRNELLEVIVFE